MRAEDFLMPRIDMHRCSHSVTTITPRAPAYSTSASADLLGQTLLHLRPASIHLNQSGELAQPHHPILGGNVAHMGHAMERQQVMLAHRIQFDVA